MAIKLYKSSLTPTVKTSNVEDRRQISLTEAQSVGKAMKGMLHSGEKLYTKHLDIKSDNELLEKSKEIMNGKDDQEGLIAVSLQAKAMKDPDKAIVLYNEKWKSLLETSKNEVSWMAKKKLSSWMNRQNLKDTNAIKIAATTNMIDALKVNITDKIENLKKSIIFSKPGSLEQKTAKQELKTLLSEKKTIELFGASLDKVRKDTARDIAFYGYKNVPINERAAALELAKKDDRLDIEDREKLESYFKKLNSNSIKLINSELSKLDEMASEGIEGNIETLNGYAATGAALNKPEIVLKAQKIKAKLKLVQSLKRMTPLQIEEFINATRADIYNTAGDQQDEFSTKQGTSTILYEQLKTAENYLAKFTTDLKKDPIMAVAKRGIFEIETINFREFRINIEDPEYRNAFLTSMIKRKSVAESISAFFGEKEQFLSDLEAAQITTELSKMDNAEQIKHLSQTLVEGFGNKAPDVFEQLNEKDQFLAHIGGLNIVSNAAGFKENKAIDLAIEGYLLNKKENLDIKVKDTDKLAYKSEYKNVFPDNINTLNNVIGAADNIYAAMHFGTSKYKSGTFDTALYKKAVEMSLGKNGDYGGVAEYNGKAVHVPMWLKNDEFNDFVDWIKEHPAVLADASGSMINGVWHPGDAVGRKQTDGSTRAIQIFEGGNPYLISVGYGKYKVAMGDHPTDTNADPKYVQDGNFHKEGNNFFIIDFNKIRSNWESMRK